MAGVIVDLDKSELKQLMNAFLTMSAAIASTLIIAVIAISYPKFFNGISIPILFLVIVLGVMSALLGILEAFALSFSIKKKKKKSMHHVNRSIE